MSIPAESLKWYDRCIASGCVEKDEEELSNEQSGNVKTGERQPDGWSESQPGGNSCAVAANCKPAKNDTEEDAQCKGNANQPKAGNWNAGNRFDDVFTIEGSTEISLRHMWHVV